MKIEKTELEFINFLRKRTDVNIEQVDVYATKQFKLTLIDPLLFNTISIITCNIDGVKRKFWILNPSRFSKWWDIYKLLLNIQKKNES